MQYVGTMQAGSIRQEIPLLARFIAKLIVDALPAAMASVIGGFLITQYQVSHQAPRPAAGQVAPASAEMMALVRDEHSMIVDYLKTQMAAEKSRHVAEDQAEARAAANARLAAAAEAAAAAAVPVPAPAVRVPGRDGRSQTRRNPTQGSGGAAAPAAGDGADRYSGRDGARGNDRAGIEVASRQDARHQGQRRPRHVARGVGDRQHSVVDRRPHRRQQRQLEFRCAAVHDIVVM